MRVRTSNPGMPWRKGGVPFAPEVDGANGGGAAAKPPEVGVTTAAKKDEAKADATQAINVEAAKAVTPEKKDDAAAEVKAAPMSKIEELEAKVVERLTTLDKRIERETDKARLKALRRMGADPEKIDDEDLLRLAPKVDPEEGMAELIKWKEKKASYFRPLDVGPQENLERYQEQLKANDKLTPAQREARVKLAKRLSSGGDR